MEVELNKFIRICVSTVLLTYALCLAIGLIYNTGLHLPYLTISDSSNLLDSTLSLLPIGCFPAFAAGIIMLIRGNKNWGFGLLLGACIAEGLTFLPTLYTYFFLTKF